MKGPSKFLFAVISTLLLAVGAAQAAAKFEPPDQSDQVGGKDSEALLPSLPCLGPRNVA